MDASSSHALRMLVKTALVIISSILDNVGVRSHCCVEETLGCSCFVLMIVKTES